MGMTYCHVIFQLVILGDKGLDKLWTTPNNLFYLEKLNWLYSTAGWENNIAVTNCLKYYELKICFF